MLRGNPGRVSIAVKDSTTVSGTPVIDPVAARFQDYAHYHQHLRIQDYETHQIIPLRLNEIQRRIYNTITQNEIDGRPTRLIILKARREGVSTLVQSMFAHRAFTRPELHALTVSHEDESTQKLHKMTERMWENLPPAMRPKKDSGIRGKRIVLTHKSSIEVATAGGDGEVARSGGYTHLHLSEVAQYPSAQTTLGGVLPTIPATPGTLVVMESTAKGRTGRGGEFYQRWVAAEAATSGYQRFFFGWFEFPKYRMQPPYGFTQTKEERALADEFGLDDAQIYWRRYTIETDYKTNPDIFVEEYPATADEAFLSSGRLYFDRHQVAALPVMEPKYRGDLVGGVERGSKLRLEEQPDGPLRVYETRVEGHRYFVFVDIAGTVKPSEFEQFQDKRDAEDYSCAWVVDLSTGATVAVWHGRIDPDLLGEACARIGYLYHCNGAPAIVCPEMNGGYGSIVAGVLRRVGYPAIERRYQTDTARQRRMVGYGWLTTNITRPLMLDNLRLVLREHPEFLRDAGLKAEMGQFVVGPTGREEADVGCHDDRVLGAAGAYQGFARHATRERIATRKQRPLASVSQRAQKELAA